MQSFYITYITISKQYHDITIVVSTASVLQITTSNYHICNLHPQNKKKLDKNQNVKL